MGLLDLKSRGAKNRALAFIGTILLRLNAISYFLGGIGSAFGSFRGHSSCDDYGGEATKCPVLICKNLRPNSALPFRPIAEPVFCRKAVGA